MTCLDRTDDLTKERDAVDALITTIEESLLIRLWPKEALQIRLEERGNEDVGNNLLVLDREDVVIEAREDKGCFH